MLSRDLCEELLQVRFVWAEDLLCSPSVQLVDQL
jgi:hypothetical protein